MGILSVLSEYIDISYIYEGYDMIPVPQVNPDNNVSFIVSNNGDRISSVKILKTDGTPVDATNDTYDYKDVYATVKLELDGKEYDYDIENVKKWILNKLATMNYATHPVVIDDEKYDANEYRNAALDTTQYAARRNEKI